MDAYLHQIDNYEMCKYIIETSTVIIFYYYRIRILTLDT